MAVFSLIAIIVFSQNVLIFSQPIVEVEQGLILGKTEQFESGYLELQKDVDVYLGIPYAEPPVGERRFAAPLPKEPWGNDQAYDATFNRDICVQTSSEASYFTQSEDCLHLNVYAPNPRPTNAAVMVFIFGGNFQNGNPYKGYYGGKALSVIGDVVYVAINYRVSAFGFLTTGDEALPGNLGMLDQVEALRWIKRNIRAFGGDDNNITIFGESAGAACVSAHLFSPLSKDLFNQAILQSGSVLNDWAFKSPAPNKNAEREAAFKLGREVGCSASTTHDLVACMRQVDAQELNSASYQLGYYYFTRIDGIFFKESPFDSLQRNDFKQCPIIHGFNKDEFTQYTTYYFSQTDDKTPPSVSKIDFETQLSGFLVEYGMFTNNLIEDGFKEVYVDWSKLGDPEADYYDEWNHIATDYWFSCAALLESRAHAMTGEHDVYMYYFTHAPSAYLYATPDYNPRWYGATHGEELHFVFGYPFDSMPYLDFHEYTEEEMSLSFQIIKYWTNFAKTGNPNKESSTAPPYSDERAWPTFAVPGLQYKELTLNLTDGSALRVNECHFWHDYLPKLRTYSADLESKDREWTDEFYSWKYTDRETWSANMEEWTDEFKKYQADKNN